MANQLNEFMYEIEGYSKRNYYKQDQEYSTHDRILDILIEFCNDSKNLLARQNALQWI